MKNIFLVVVALSHSLFSYANVRLPKIFGNNMVLQRSKPIPVWGWADVGEKITVQFNKQVKSIHADEYGHWMVKLNSEVAGGPYRLTVKGKNGITFNNILVGEVWICSGQSNMEFEVRSAINAGKEMAGADYAQIRHFKIPAVVPASLQYDKPGGEWIMCSPENAGAFTAIGYFFAKELYSRLKVPVGLINASWGGTEIETWMSRGALENSEEFRSMIKTLPPFNHDSLERAGKEATIKEVEALQGPLVNVTDVVSWKDSAMDDSKWPKMKIPSLWEAEQLGDLDGIVWFRKMIDISAKDTGKAATLNLGMIDDNDITYVNGAMAGSTNGYNKKRAYAIPAGVLKEGKNLIAVRVTDTGDGGGIYGDSANLNLRIGDHIIPLAGNWSFRVESLSNAASYIDPNSYPSMLFNAMIKPLIPCAFRGVLWYQGESNTDRAYQYRKAFPLLIKDWRTHWHQGNFPFYFVQLASFNAANGNSKNGSAWAELREAQTMALSLAGTGMCVTTDIGEAKDIHPKDKQDVGKRLAAIALHNLYENKDMVCAGPVYQSMETALNRTILSFKNIGSGLSVKGSDGILKGFEIAGVDKQFHDAKGFIEGNRVIMYSDSVSSPAVVRFGWADDAGIDNLFNKEGFPAGPFRTDHWKGITEGKKYSIGH
ncbi:MAG: sialate O-acetylesterase [Ginsengibacter sp.]